jgi:hypothetical protein
MTHEEIKLLLNDYFDERLSVEANTEIQVHISECSECSQYLFSLQDLMKETDKLPSYITPPSDFWPDIFSSLSDIKIETLKKQEELDSQEAARISEDILEDKLKREERVKAEKLLEWEKKKSELRAIVENPGFKYSVIAILSFGLLFFIYKSFIAKGEVWEVKKVMLGNASYSETFLKLGEGEIVETNSITRLLIQVPDIGSIYLEPETKVERLQGNKIKLVKGEISTNKEGANDFLSIEIPGAEIKDFLLGGKSKITILNKKSFLEVSDGWVSVRHDDLETLVLTKHYCEVREETGPGLPYHLQSSREFITAVHDYSFEKPGNEESLIQILTKANVSNSVTLWNLLERVNLKQRDMVVYTIIGLLGELPKGVTDEGLKTLDKMMMQILIEEIELKI